MQSYRKLKCLCKLNNQSIDWNYTMISYNYASDKILMKKHNFFSVFPFSDGRIMNMFFTFQNVIFIRHMEHEN